MAGLSFSTVGGRATGWVSAARRTREGRATLRRFGFAQKTVGVTPAQATVVQDLLLKARNEVGVRLSGGVMSFPPESHDQILAILELRARHIRGEAGTEPSAESRSELIALEGLARKVRQA